MENTQKLTFMNKAALQGLSVVSMLILALTGGLAYMIADLQISVSNAVLVLMIPSFVGIPFTLATGVFCSKFGSRGIAIIGAIIFAVSGVMPFFVAKSFALVMLFRAIHGVGYGITQGVATVLLKDYCPPEELARMNGIKQALSNAFAIIYGIVGGALANIGWNYSYLLYFIVFPVFIIMILFLPKKALVDVTAQSTGEKHKIHLTGTSWGWIVGMFIFMLSIAVFSNQMSNYIVNNGISDSTGAGTIVSISTACGFFAGLAFAKVFTKLGKWTMPLALALVGITMIMIPMTHNYWVVAIAGGLQGLAYSTAVPCAVMGASTSTDPISASTAISWMVAAMLLGNVVSEYIVGPLAGFFSADGAAGRYIVAGIIGFICMVYFFIVQNAQAKKAASAK